VRIHFNFRERISVSLGIGVLLLIPAAWLYARALAEEHSRYWERLAIPVSLAAGTINTPEFEIDRTGYYDINIEFQLKMDLLKMQCLLGIVEMDRWNRFSQLKYASQCKNIPDLIDISWELFEGGKIVEIAPTVVYQGNSQEYSSTSWEPGVAIWRQIGNFRAQKGHRYTLVLHVKRDASQLNIANPKVTVTVPPPDDKDRRVGVAIRKDEMCILTLIGSIFVIFGIFTLEFVPRKT
jgi:hypothetical protein